MFLRTYYTLGTVWTLFFMNCLNSHNTLWDGYKTLILLANKLRLSVQFSCSSRVRLFATPWTATRQASLSITNSQSLPKLISIELVMPSNHLTLCHPLLLLHSIFPSIEDFSNELVLCIRWPKYWSFSFSISPSSEYSGLISFVMDWLDLLAVQGTLKSLLQHHSWSASSALGFLYGPTLTSYIITGKTIALTIQNFVCKVISLLF